jgi:transposase-like protein
LRGGYGRNLWVAEGPDTAHVRMVRAECPRCARSHSLIPSALAPRSPYPQWVREKAVQEHKRGKRVRRISEELGVPRTTLSRWIRAFKTKEARIAAAMRAILVACRQRAAEARETLAELVGRASRALGFKAKCKLVSSRTNVLLCYAKSEGHVTWSVPLL